MDERITRVGGREARASGSVVLPGARWRAGWVATSERGRPTPTPVRFESLAVVVAHAAALAVALRASRTPLRSRSPLPSSPLSTPRPEPSRPLEPRVPRRVGRALRKELERALRGLERLAAAS